MDPDYYIWQEFLAHGMDYECQNCGALFGDACVAQNGRIDGSGVTCPDCGVLVVSDATDRGSP